MLTQVLLLLLGQLEALRLQTLDHGLPKLGVLPGSVRMQNIGGVICALPAGTTF